jgi:hypothetical protein
MREEAKKHDGSYPQNAFGTLQKKQHEMQKTPVPKNAGRRYY